MGTPGINIIAKNDATNLLYFATDLGQTWPEENVITYERAVSTNRMIPGFDPGTGLAIPGERTIIDAGFSKPTLGDVKNFHMPFLDQDRKEALEAQYAITDTFLWSPDDGTTVFICAWAEGNSLVIKSIEGFPGKFYTGDAQFYIVGDSEVTLPSFSGAFLS